MNKKHPKTQSELIMDSFNLSRDSFNLPRDSFNLPKLIIFNPRGLTPTPASPRCQILQKPSSAPDVSPSQKLSFVLSASPSRELFSTANALPSSQKHYRSSLLRTQRITRNAAKFFRAGLSLPFKLLDSSFNIFHSFLKSLVFIAHPNNPLYLLLKFINEKIKKWSVISFYKFFCVNVGGFNNNYNSFLSTANKEII
jgi:hypothetical protein